VYDITKKISFNEIKSYWYPQLKEYAPRNLIIGLAANKCDLYEYEEVDEHSANDFAKVII